MLNMNTISLNFCLCLLLYYLETSKSVKFGRRSRNEIYVPSLIKFEVRGKSLAWLPIDICGIYDDVRERRFIQGAGSQLNESIEPEIIYDADEDAIDTDDVTAVQSTTVEEEEEGCEITTPVESWYDRTETTTRMPHIETPPYPRRPLNLVFPTCQKEDCLIIEPPNFSTIKCSRTRMNTSKSGKIRKLSQIVNVAEATKKYEPNVTNTIHEKSTWSQGTANSKTTHLKHTMTSTCPTARYLSTLKTEGEKSTDGFALKDTKVVVRIPPSLAELPIEILRDPKSEMLSLSLISGERLQKPMSVLEQHVYPLLHPVRSQLQPQIPLDTVYQPVYSDLYGKQSLIGREKSIFPRMFPPPVFYKGPQFGQRAASVPRYMGHFIRWMRSLEKTHSQKTNKTK